MMTGRTQRKLVYEKKISIDLPYGRGQKQYCCLITYRPPDCKCSPESVITVTIKPSSKTCRHEDTHLFVRFAGYYSTLESKINLCYFVVITNYAMTSSYYCLFLLIL